MACHINVSHLCSEELDIGGGIRHQRAGIRSRNLIDPPASSSPGEATEHSECVPGQSIRPEAKSEDLLPPLWQSFLLVKKVLDVQTLDEAKRMFPRNRIIRFAWKLSFVVVWCFDDINLFLLVCLT